MRRRAARTDRNQPEIVRALRQVGATVWITAALGTGVDIVVGKDGRNILMEVKDPLQKPSQRQLTVDEKAFHYAWAGQIAVVETAEEALALLGPSLECWEGTK